MAWIDIDVNVNNGEAPANDGWKDVPAEDTSFMGGLESVGKATLYNLNKMGAGVNAGLANLNEMVGAESSLFRDNQKYYTDNANEYHQPNSPILEEAYNPVNFTPYGRGMKLLGSAAGAAVTNEANNAVVTGKEFSGQDAAINTGATMLAVPAIDLMVRGASKLKSLPRRMAVGESGMGNTAAEIADLQVLAKKHGVELTPASITGSPTLARTEQNINQSVVSRMGMNQSIHTEKQGIDGAIMKQLEDMGANGSNVNAGEGLSSAINANQASDALYFQKKFGGMFAGYGDQPLFSVRGLKAEAQAIVNRAERNPIIKNSAAYRDAKAIAATDEKLSWADWQTLRTHLGGLASDKMVTSNASTGQYKNLYSKLAQDLDDSVNALGVPNLKKQYDSVIDEYKTFKSGLGKSGDNDFGSNFVNKVAQRNINPESIGGLINNSSLRADAALATGGVDKATGLPVAKKTSATDILLSSKAKNDDGLWLPSFLKYTDKEGFKRVANAPKMQRDATKALFDNTNSDVMSSRVSKPVDGNTVSDLTTINELRDIAIAINDKDKSRNFSNTAVQNWMNQLKVMKPFAMATTIAKEGGMSALYNSSAFKRWVSEGIITKQQLAQINSFAAKRGSESRHLTGGYVNALFNNNKDKKQSATKKLGLQKKEN